MTIYNYLKKKLIRLQGSKNVLKLNYLIEKYFKDKKLGNVGLDFTSKPKRQFIVQKIIDIKNFNSYLEIGTFKDELFSQIRCKKKVGVDPVSGGTIRKTSDQFFLENNDKFDIIFIDGLHTYKQVKKDILNSVKCLNQNGIILVHDCMPDSLGKQAVPRYKMQWNGDVWKAIVDLRQNSNLDIYTCEMDQGIGVITNKSNSSLLRLEKPINKIKFKDYFDNYKEYMRVISLTEFKKKF